jgi:hypothetical protein
MTTPSEIIELYDKLDGEKSTLKGHLQEIIDYMVPSAQGLYSDLSLGSKRMTKIYDGTAIRALRVFANGLYGNLTPLSTPWFALTCKNKSIAESANVMFWLSDTTERMRNAINASNAPLALHELYFAEGWAGTGIMYISPGKRYSLNCETFNVGNVCVTEDAEGVVDGVYRLEKFTARQCVQKWGNQCSAEIHKAYKGMEPNKLFDIIHAVYPRNDYDWAKKNAENMPFASQYIEKQSGNLLANSGYQEFPFVVPRWDKTTGETYGRSPAMDALPDVKMLNQMCYDNMRGIQKQIDPPILASKESNLSSTNTKPGGVIYHKSGEVPTAFNTNGRFDVALEVEEQRRKAIKEAFYNDLFQLLAQDPTSDRTAYEISKRLEENLSILGPALGRQQTEGFDPFLSRVFAILLRQGMFLPIPRELAGQGLSIDYVGRLALAMKSQETQATGQTLSFVGQFAEVRPEVLDNYDFDEIAQGTAQRTGMPIKYLVSPEQRDKVRQARAEAQEKAMQAEQEQALMSQLPNLGKAIEPNSPADALAKVMGAGK